MMYFCCDRKRRELVLNSGTFNGIDYLEVLDDPQMPMMDRQRTLLVHFLQPLTPAQLGPDNVAIEGGERITNIKVVDATIGTDGVLTVEVDQPGDFSIYTLCLVTDALDPTPPADIDPLFASIDFSFKVECPSEFDCLPQRVCPTEPRETLKIDYLAKDYASFLRVMQDRVAVNMPDRREKHAADVGNLLLELLADAGDKLSYRQDAIATEAYLATARSRISVRRHARLVDYFMHDGCNARTWVQFWATGANQQVTREINVGGDTRTVKLLTRVDRLPDIVEPDSKAYRDALRMKPAVFEPMHDVTAFSAHNEIGIYTWGDDECCLPKGATEAYLLDDDDPAARLHLRTGDVLVFEEVLGPETGNAGDADPTHRHAVRLMHVEPEATLDFDGVTRIPGLVQTDSLTSTPYVRIAWDRTDALPFPVCVSSKAAAGDVTVVRGNIVLADHGMTIVDETIGVVPEPEIALPPTGTGHCSTAEPIPVPPRFRPSLAKRPLTQAGPFNVALPATAAMQWAMQTVMPEVLLLGMLGTDERQWLPRHDLINSDDTDRHFVAEVEHDGRVLIRFGDDSYGRRPTSATKLLATYRVGNGPQGNIAHDSIAHLVTNQSGITHVRNITPGRGGRRPEAMEEVRRYAPVAFRRQERAVTEEDYAEVTERKGDVQQAAATFRWTGSWHTVFLTVDRELGAPVDDNFEQAARTHVERFRMAGHDLEVDGPRFVPLKMAMFVCAKPDFFRADVKQALLGVLGADGLPDGRRGYFHPDNWTFGQTVHLSPLYALVQSIDGVASVQFTTFERLYAPRPEALEKGRLELSRLEVARLRNDPGFPEHGSLRIEMGGGK